MSEAELCSWFQEAAESAGFVVYNEWGGYDQILVRPDGIQIGIEAKLRANIVVLSQIISPRGWKSHSTQFRAVLVPKASKEFLYVASVLRVLVFEKRMYSARYSTRYWTLPTKGDYLWGGGVTLPEVVPDVVGGKRSPIRLTPWKIKAIKLCNRLRKNGFVTTLDFKEEGVDATIWKSKWLVAQGKDGRRTKYVKRSYYKDPMPDEQHPDVAAKLRDE